MDICARAATLASMDLRVAGKIVELLRYLSVFRYVLGIWQFWMHLFLVKSDQHAFQYVETVQLAWYGCLFARTTSIAEYPKCSLFHRIYCPIRSEILVNRVKFMDMNGSSVFKMEFHTQYLLLKHFSNSFFFSQKWTRKCCGC